jgi:hypothetical protein
MTRSSIEELTARVRAFAQERDWGQFHPPKNLVMAAAGEMGELVAEFRCGRVDSSAQISLASFALRSASTRDTACSLA